MSPVRYSSKTRRNSHTSSNRHRNRYRHRRDLNEDLFDEDEDYRRDRPTEKPLSPDSLWKELQFQRYLRSRIRKNMQAKARVVDEKGRPVTLAERIIRQKLLKSKDEATATQDESQESTSNIAEPPSQEDKKKTFINLLHQYIHQREAETACSSRLLEEISEAKQTLNENVYKRRMSSSAREVYSSSNISLGDSATNYNAKFGAIHRGTVVDNDCHSLQDNKGPQHNVVGDGSEIQQFDGGGSVEKNEYHKESKVIVLDDSHLLQYISESAKDTKIEKAESGDTHNGAVNKQSNNATDKLKGISGCLNSSKGKNISVGLNDNISGIELNHVKSKNKGVDDKDVLKSKDSSNVILDNTRSPSLKNTDGQKTNIDNSEHIESPGVLKTTTHCVTDALATSAVGVGNNGEARGDNVVTQKVRVHFNDSDNVEMNGKSDTHSVVDTFHESTTAIISENAQNKNFNGHEDETVATAPSTKDKVENSKGIESNTSEANAASVFSDSRRDQLNSIPGDEDVGVNVNQADTTEAQSKQIIARTEKKSNNAEIGLEYNANPDHLVKAGKMTPVKKSKEKTDSVIGKGNSTRSNSREEGVDSDFNTNVSMNYIDDKKSEKDSALENSDDETKLNPIKIKNHGSEPSSNRAYQFTGFNLARAYSLPELVPADLNEIFTGHHHDLPNRERGQKLTLITSPKGSNTTITSHILPSWTYKSCLPLPPVQSPNVDSIRRDNNYNPKSSLNSPNVKEAALSCPNMNAYRDSSFLSSDSDDYTSDDEIDDSGFLNNRNYQSPQDSTGQDHDKKLHETISGIFISDSKRQNARLSFKDMADREKRVIGLYNELKCFSLLQRSKENISIAMASRPNGLHDIHIEWGSEKMGDTKTRKKQTKHRKRYSRVSPRVYDTSKYNSKNNNNINASAIPSPWEPQRKPHEFIYLRDLSFSHYVAKAVYENRLHKYMEHGQGRDSHVLKKRPRPRIKKSNDSGNQANPTTGHKVTDNKTMFPLINRSQNVSLISSSSSINDLSTSLNNSSNQTSHHFNNERGKKAYNKWKKRLKFPPINR